MTPTERCRALRKWDAEIIAAYREGLEPAARSATGECECTIQRAYLRDLIPVLADVAVRSSDALGPSLTTLQNTKMRDAAIEFALRRYLSALPSAQATARSAIGERILAGLTHRREPKLHHTLITMTIRLPTKLLSELDREIERVLSGIDLTELGDWHGDFAVDVRSSVIEAVTVEWMRLRADAFGIGTGRARSHDHQPMLKRQRNRERRGH